MNKISVAAAMNIDCVGLQIYHAIVSIKSWFIDLMKKRMFFMCHDKQRYRSVKISRFCLLYHGTQHHVLATLQSEEIKN